MKISDQISSYKKENTNETNSPDQVQNIEIGNEPTCFVYTCRFYNDDMGEGGCETKVFSSYANALSHLENEVNEFKKENTFDTCDTTTEENEKKFVQYSFYNDGWYLAGYCDFTLEELPIN